MAPINRCTSSTITADVRDIATREKLNKSQTKVLNEVAVKSPDMFAQVAGRSLSSEPALSLLLPSWEEAED
jgi:hypothetical protein